MMLIFLAASKPASRMTLNSVGSAAFGGRAPAAAGAGHHHRAAGGRFDAVLFLEQVLQFDGLGDREVGELCRRVRQRKAWSRSFQNQCRVKRPGGERNSWLGMPTDVGRRAFGSLSSLLAVGFTGRRCRLRLGGGRRLLLDRLAGCRRAGSPGRPGSRRSATPARASRASTPPIASLRVGIVLATSKRDRLAVGDCRLFLDLVRRLRVLLQSPSGSRRPRCRVP